MFFDTGKIAERKIQEAMEEGVFDNLPGKGKPLELDDAPLEVRILRNAGVVPDWIQLIQEIEKTRAFCERFWMRLEKEYPRRHALLSAPGRGTIDPEMARRNFADWHTRNRDTYLNSVKQVNTDILKLNYIAPRLPRAQIPYKVAEETARFDAAFPAID